MEILIIVSGIVVIVGAVFTGTLIRDGEYAAAAMTGVVAVILQVVFFAVVARYTIKTLVNESMICPTCASIYADDSVYCPKDGSQLIWANISKEEDRA